MFMIRKGPVYITGAGIPVYNSRCQRWDTSVQQPVPRLGYQCTTAGTGAGIPVHYSRYRGSAVARDSPTANQAWQGTSAVNTSAPWARGHHTGCGGHYSRPTTSVTQPGGNDVGHNTLGRSPVRRKGGFYPGIRLLIVM